MHRYFNLFFFNFSSFLVQGQKGTCTCSKYHQAQLSQIIAYIRNVLLMQADSSRSYILPLANKDVGSTRVHGGCTLAMRWPSIRVHVYEQSESNKQNKHCLSQKTEMKNRVLHHKRGRERKYRGPAKTSSNYLCCVGV